MPGAVKGRRPYRSPRRAEQAAATRRSILDAAARRFEAQGYAATTMEAIATEAGVSLKTVYVAFTTKSGLLRALWDLRLKGDQDHSGVAERPWYREVLEEPDPELQLRRNAKNARAVKERIAAVLEVIRDAAPVDGDTAALWELIQTDFYENQRVIVTSIADKGALRPGLDLTRATDILWTLNHPDQWFLLVGRRGWSADEFEQWFADVSCAQLLRPDPLRP
jgi:AcrR family transcriptional regulator